MIPTCNAMDPCEEHVKKIGYVPQALRNINELLEEVKIKRAGSKMPFMGSSAGGYKYDKLFSKYFNEKKKVFPAKLLNGFEIMRVLKISEGPEVGKILQKLEEAQVTKKIKTKDEAKRFIKRIYPALSEKNKS